MSDFTYSREHVRLANLDGVEELLFLKFLDYAQGEAM